MESVKQKVEKYKRGVREQYKPFVKQGLLTDKELDFIVNGSSIKFLSALLREC